jgi:hypothetical protein
VQRTARLVLALAIVPAAVACGDRSTPQDGRSTPGADRTGTTAVLESGANLLQQKAPVEAISMHLDGFHAAKDDPAMQMEAHHFCNQLNEDFAQCVLFDGDGADARMTGVEYIISEALYGQLPEQERAYWHPHNYELLSGQLRMPGLPEAAEDAALKRKMNSYGKTWHTWHSGSADERDDALPLGAAVLQWSFNRDGEARDDMIAERDRRMKFDTAGERARRSSWTSLAHPQDGVDAMKRAMAR